MSEISSEEEFMPIGCIVYAMTEDEAIEKAKEAFEAIKGEIDDFPDVRDIGKECFVSANTKVGREFAKDCLTMSAFGPLLFDHQGMPITCGRELTAARTGYRQLYKKLMFKSPHEGKKVWILSAQLKR